MTNLNEKCNEMVDEPPRYWHRHVCGKTAKYLVSVGSNISYPVCGIHKRMWERRAGKRYEPTIEIHPLR